MFSYHRKKKKKTCRADFGRQMRGDKKHPLNGATSYGRLWRKGAGKRAVVGKQTVPTAVRIRLRLPFSDVERCGFMDDISLKK